MANPNRDHRLTSNFYGSAQGPASHGSEYGSAQNNVPFTYDPNAPPFVASTSSIYGSEQLIGMECFGCEPHFGWIGTPLTLSLRCRQPIPFHRTRAFLVAFGFKSEGRLEPSGVDSQQCQYYWFRVIAPHIGRTTIEGALDAPLSVHLESFSGGLVSFADAGLFRYDPALAITGNAQTEREQSRKRRMSAESTGHAPLKKTSSQHLQQAKSEAQSRRTSSVLDFDHAAETSASPSTSAKPRPQAATSQQEYNTTAGVQHASARPSQINVPSPMTGPGMRTSPQSAVTGYNGGSASYSSRNAESLSGQWNDDNVRDSAGSRSIPLLVRTSTVPNPMPKKGDADPPSAESYQQYAAYEENKAFLEIQGDLDSMAQNWTEDEKKTHRRLVEFEREQDGNHVSTTFRPVSLEERAPNSICVSCIWWEEKQEAYVTSVDTIQLLESLVAVRFTVEEKNRIRRNLEGFHPKTVAKGKPDSEKFFKTIMDFPNPKPRNIEKDVKVFPWHVLKHALKKIVGKYVSSAFFGMSSFLLTTTVDDLSRLTTSHAQCLTSSILLALIRSISAFRPSPSNANQHGAATRRDDFAITIPSSELRLC